MMDRFTQPFTLLLGPIYFIFSILWGHYLIAGILFTWWHLSRAIKIFPHLRHRPSDLLILPVYVATTFYLGLLKMYALLTIRRQGWITRWDKDRMQGTGAFLHFMVRSASYVGVAAILAIMSFFVAGSRGAPTEAQLPNNERPVTLPKAPPVTAIVYCTHANDPQEKVCAPWINVPLPAKTKESSPLSPPPAILPIASPSA